MKHTEEHVHEWHFYEESSDGCFCVKGCSGRLSRDEAEARLNATERLSAEELVETLADIEHERWSSWMRYQFDNWKHENIERWKVLMETPYKDLPEHSKESDRREARKTLDAIHAYADILEGKNVGGAHGQNI